MARAQYRYASGFWRWGRYNARRALVADILAWIPVIRYPFLARHYPTHAEGL